MNMTVAQHMEFAACQDAVSALVEDLAEAADRDDPRAILAANQRLQRAACNYAAALQGREGGGMATAGLERALRGVASLAEALGKRRHARDRAREGATAYLLADRRGAF